jgi:hypothetical protein
LVIAATVRFSSEVTTVCAAAYERLVAEMAAAGLELGDPADIEAYFQVMARVLDESLPQLRALVPPDPSRLVGERLRDADTPAQRLA